MKESEKHYQVGNVIKIIRPPKFAKRFGLTVDTEHVIIKPPEGKLNSGLSIWVNDSRNIPFQIDFYMYVWTGKVVAPKRVRKTVTN